MRNKQPCVYIMANDIRTIYVGVTSDIFSRVWQHKFQSKPNSFAGTHNCSKLVHFSEFARMDDAIAFEKFIKGKKRSVKVDLIEKCNPAWLDLARDWYE